MLAEQVQEAGSGCALTSHPVLRMTDPYTESDCTGDLCSRPGRGSGAEVREEAPPRVAVVQNGGTEQHYLIQSSWLRVQASGE